MPPHAAGSDPCRPLPLSFTSVSRASRHQLAGSVPDTRSPKSYARTLVNTTSDPFTSSGSSGSTTLPVSRGEAKFSDTTVEPQLTCRHWQ
ncbi:hypothetical protein NESM_000890800 [Novymonas esmeraldas]|uniref:Uncharacterized protein n=1 Tax=Novymonas esmeraldas TaxID=1808958 RepID=A0AAW0F0F3_9TRYP